MCGSPILFIVYDSNHEHHRATGARSPLPPPLTSPTNQNPTPKKAKDQKSQTINLQDHDIHFRLLKSPLEQ